MPKPPTCKWVASTNPATFPKYWKYSEPARISNAIWTMLIACVCFLALLIFTHALAARWYKAQAVHYVRSTLQSTINEYLARYPEEDSVDALYLLSAMDREWVEHVQYA